ncbi:MAG: MFS transporter, partial [Candidatus Thermoplasmatota archaeon]|nr:MFS transporter [Candidatus Thermoplasmatota archaeon]
YNLHLPKDLALTLTAFMYPIQYGIPILSGALAEKIGYRKQIIFAFIFLTAAYAMLSFANSAFTAIISVMAVGFGIGCYKPLVQSTIAKCTSSEDRNQAYSIYYWVVNLGAFVFPMAYVALEQAGIVSTSAYSIVFMVGAIMVSLNILIGLLFFKEVPRTGEVKSVKDALNNIRIAFKDGKFIIMMLLISGFWGLYSTMLNALPIIVIGFKFTPEWFSPMLISLFNPLTIIALGIPLGKFCEKIESLRSVMAGVLLYAIGIIIIGFFMNVTGVIVGTVVSSIGEFLVAPGYFSFISKLAPKEKVSAYVGCNFLSSMLGLAGGTLIFGKLADAIGIEMEMPHFFYGLLIAMSLLLLLLFMLYYRKWGKEIIAKAAEIQAAEAPAAQEKKDEVKEPAIFKIFDFKASLIIPVVLIPIMLVLSFGMGTSHYYGVDEGTGEGTFDLGNYNVVAGPGTTISNHANENSQVAEQYALALAEGQLLKSITITLTWTDEADTTDTTGLIALQNQPDTFGFQLSADSPAQGSAPSTANARGSSGTASWSHTFEPKSAASNDGVGAYKISVICGDCGDFTAPSGLTMLNSADTGNDYKITITTQTYVPKSGMPIKNA